MRQPVCRLASAVVLAVLSMVPFASAAQPVPQELQPPADESLVFRLHGRGDQIYSCKMDGAQFAWVLKAPDAQLFYKNGKLFGKHFAGPSWEASDGSRITGKAIAKASPDPDSIPWLLVNVVGHDGSGRLSRVATVQRLNTKGGKSPATGCDAAHVGGEVRVPYSAEYLFYAPEMR